MTRDQGTLPIRPALFGLACLTLLGGCANASRLDVGPPPELEVVPPRVRTPAVGLPFHRAAIVDLELLPPGPGERWRLATADAEGWLRIWVDGRLATATEAHLGGISALATAPDGTLYSAGFDGRVLEWRSGPKQAAKVPALAFDFGDPITGLDVSAERLAISTGDYVQLWSRVEEPELLWSKRPQAFVTGLSLSAEGGVLAAAEISQYALRDGLANHPLAEFRGPGAEAYDEQTQYNRRWMAARDYPGATASLIEVWQPARKRTRELHPRAPIAGDIELLPRGGVAYREIYGPSASWLTAQRLEDRSYVGVPVVKPMAFWSSESSQDWGQAGPPVGDFVVDEAGQLVAIDAFLDWGAVPTAQGWWVGDGRELALGHNHAALGDKHGNLAVVSLNAPSGEGWRGAGEEVAEMLASASERPVLVTSRFEPRTRYRQWSLEAGTHRMLRVESPKAIVRYAPTQAQPEPPPVELFPLAMTLDGRGDTLATSLWSFAEDALGVIRVHEDGADPKVVTSVQAPSGLTLALSPDGEQLIAWQVGVEAKSWLAPDWKELGADAAAGAAGSPANAGATGSPDAAASADAAGSGAAGSPDAAGSADGAGNSGATESPDAAGSADAAAGSGATESPDAAGSKDGAPGSGDGPANDSAGASGSEDAAAAKPAPPAEPTIPAEQLARGVPLFSVNAAWSAHLTPKEWRIVDLRGQSPTRVITRQDEVQDADVLATLSGDGTLAVVQPFGAGEVVLAAPGKDPEVRLLPGAATALAWVERRDGSGWVLLVGFQDGSIASIDPTVQPISAEEAAAAEGPIDVPIKGMPPMVHPGEGGRVWALAPLGGHPGVFVELDERNLTLHRLEDGATIVIHVADSTALRRSAGSPQQDPRSTDMVAIWEPGTARPPCRVLDGSAGGVIVSAGVEVWGPERAGEFFAAFSSGQSCGPSLAEEGEDAGAGGEGSGEESPSTPPVQRPGGGGDGEAEGEDAAGEGESDAEAEPAGDDES